MQLAVEEVICRKICNFVFLGSMVSFVSFNMIYYKHLYLDQIHEQRPLTTFKLHFM